MKEGILGNSKKMEEYYQYCQEHYKEEPKLLEDMWLLAKEALYSCMTKRTKELGIINDDWEDRLYDGLIAFMMRYKKNPDYQIKHLFKVMHYQMLNYLCNSQYTSKYEYSYPLTEDISDSYSFEDELLDRLEKEGY